MTEPGFDGDARSSRDEAGDPGRRVKQRPHAIGQLGDAEGALRDLDEAIGEAQARGEVERAERLERLRASRTAQTT